MTIAKTKVWCCLPVLRAVKIHNTCVLNRPNKQTRNSHIITLEEPIEYLHKNIMSVVSQREIGNDTQDYNSTRACCVNHRTSFRGRNADYETIRTMTAAETGHLVISMLHAVGAVNTVDRVIDVFPSNQQQQSVSNFPSFSKP